MDEIDVEKVFIAGCDVYTNEDPGEHTIGEDSVVVVPRSTRVDGVELVVGDRFTVSRDSLEELMAAGSAASGGRDWSCLTTAPAAAAAPAPAPAPAASPSPEPVRMSPEHLSMAIEQLLMSNGYRLNVEPRYAISLVDVTAQ